MTVCATLFLLWSMSSQHLYLLREFNTNEASIQGVSFGVPRIKDSPSSQSIANGSNSGNVPSSPIPTNINKIVSIETINTTRNKNRVTTSNPQQQPLPNKDNRGTVATVNVQKRPPTLFLCVNDLGNAIGEATAIFRSILPEYNFVSIAAKHKFKTKMDIDIAFRQQIVEEEGRNNPWDFLLIRVGEKCTESDWVRNNFTGNILYVSGESIGEPYTLDAGNKFLIGPTSESNRTYTLTYMQMVWWLWMSGESRFRNSHELAQKLLDPIQRPSGKAQKEFLIYAANNCVSFRNQAFVDLSSIREAFYGGKCNGTKNPSPNRTKAENNIGLQNWWDNVEFYGGYRFCLVMEHVKEQAYITEKILMAFLGGCIPIYYGSTNIFDVFNPKSFVYYDVNNPKPALDLVRSLEGNATAYQEMLRRSILANGNNTIAKYFSFSDDLGGGLVKKQIRTKLGMDLYNFVIHSTESTVCSEGSVAVNNDSETTWWRGRADITNVSHPHLGARLWVTGNQEPLLQMIVNPSPERLSSYCNSDREIKNVNRTKDKILCPRGLDSRPTWGIEGEGGNAALLKVRGGIQEYLYNKTNSVVGKKRNSKILCMVYTVGLPESRSSLKAISETWAHRCDGFFAASNETIHSLGAIDLPHKGPEEYANMWQKIRSMWAYAYDHYRNEFDFFHIAGDDTYIVVENLRSFLDGPDVIRLEKGHLDQISSHPSNRQKAIRWVNRANVSRPLIFGVPCPHKRVKVFASGGPGYTLNRAALEVFATGGFGRSDLRESYNSREDIYVSVTLASEGVFLSHVLDQSNGWRFGESAEFTSSWHKDKPHICAQKEINSKFGLQAGDYLDSISKETSSFHLKLDKKRLKKSNQTIATLIRRYHAILYDLC